MLLLTPVVENGESETPFTGCAGYAVSPGILAVVSAVRYVSKSGVSTRGTERAPKHGRLAHVVGRRWIGAMGKGDSSPQLRWQRKQLARGNCRRCGEPRYPRSTSYCWACLETERRRHRKRLGQNAWRRGGPGQPPLESR